MRRLFYLVAIPLLFDAVVALALSLGDRSATAAATVLAAAPAGPGEDAAVARGARIGAKGKQALLF